MSLEVEQRPATPFAGRSYARVETTFTWNARNLADEARCEREVERAKSWKVRLLGWLIEYNKY